MATIDGVLATEPRDLTMLERRKWTQTKIGDALMARGDAAAALEAYEPSLAALEQRRASIHGDQPPPSEGMSEDMRRQILAWWEQGAAAEAARLQADIAVLQEKIGNALNVQKHFAAAVPRYEAALACHKGWAMAEPDNLTKQRNLLIMLNKSGDALIASNNPTFAEERFQAACEVV